MPAGTKLTPGEFDVYGSLLPDEPFFVIAARDRSAPEMLRTWALKRRKEVTAKDDGPYTDDDKEDLRKATEADAIADDMVIWRRENDGAWRDNSQLRLRTVELIAEDKEAIAAMAVKTVANAVGIPSQFHSSNFEVERHDVDPWTSPHINGLRHFIALRGVGVSRWDGRDLSLEAMTVVGHHVCDFRVAELVNAEQEEVLGAIVYTIFDR